MGVIIVSAIVAHQAWHWMVDRFTVLEQFPWPSITVAGVHSALGWLSAAVVMAALLWLTSIFIKSWTEWNNEKHRQRTEVALRALRSDTLQMQDGIIDPSRYDEAGVPQVYRR
jgi:hypothetical protein